MSHKAISSRRANLIFEIQNSRLDILNGQAHFSVLRSYLYVNLGYHLQLPKVFWLGIDSLP